MLAFMRGSLDYPAANKRDWRWRLKEEMVLEALEDELVTNMNKLSHEWHCAAAQVTGWDEDEELFNHHKKQATFAYNVIGRATLPWYKSWKTNEVSLADLWKRFKENEKDPVYAAELARLRADLRKMVTDKEDELKVERATRESWNKEQKKRLELSKRRAERAERARIGNGR